MVDKLISRGACRLRWLTSRVIHLAIAGAIVCGSLATAHAASVCGSCGGALLRPQDSIWLVSTRHLSCVGSQAGCPPLKIWQRQPGTGWTRTTTEAFCSIDDPRTITTFYVHGNRVDSDQAVAGGLSIYRVVASRATEEIRLRYVIWSWPSDRVRGPLRDVRSKARRSNLEGYYLGCLLSRLDPHDRVSLIGHSFGARIATGSLHLLAGGSLCGRVLPVDNEVVRTPVRVVAIAAALDNDWLLPGHCHGLTVSLTDRMLVMYNPRDPVLRRYPMIASGRSGQALGYTGLVCSHQLGEAAERIDQISAAPWIGKTHDMDVYARSTVLMNEVGRVALWQ